MKNKVTLTGWEVKTVEIALRAYYVRLTADINLGEDLRMRNEVEEGNRRVEWAKGKQAAIKKILDKIAQ